MHRIVLDTNTIISAVGWKGPPRKILDLCIESNIKIIISKEILDEFIEVIFRPKFDFLKDETKLTIIETIIYLSDFVEPDFEIDKIEDKKDNKFLECALSGKADFIISGDNHLLKLREFKGIKILNASKFIKEYIDK